ncbi:hypothetical protein JJB09_11890 [Rhizobium sp. KVB221]|uniref:Lipoprotein n=1 Tax=Rhizobium setariae TaxID=2801340 RepID=A0A936YTW1_9HYPH|nr:hypothetical protein [Rhizobium setariae]MBL0372732.1 hypothetical protein [Rhizobium setariae]
MLRSGLQLALMVFVALTVAACGTRPMQSDEIPQIFEIRAVVVTGNEGISHTVMRGIKRRLDRAIQDTVRPAPMPRAVMNIHVVNIVKGTGIDGGRAQSEVSVVLTDVGTGEAVLVRNYQIYSFSVSARTSDEAIAEAIAARLRFVYALSQPVIRAPTTEPPQLSTRMRSDEPAPAVRETVARPLVVPLKTAPSVGVDQDPMLNSRTKVNPEKPAKAVILPDSKLKTNNQAPAENALETGAKAKVVIQPKAQSLPTETEPCVETMDKKC